ncbi:hypothetical protein DdX_15604 [Ditylenchus destructor]|uniref:Uncharacterized protein n=1 Tax=Ditylenchus destructor TaxID=166010 RepID=A0AAD4MR62_9BILA|nr:hypothetical protein DdX_15604 [Ditylenchus destructor]
MSENAHSPKRNRRQRSKRVSETEFRFVFAAIQQNLQSQSDAMAKISNGLAPFRPPRQKKSIKQEKERMDSVPENEDVIREQVQPTKFERLEHLEFNPKFVRKYYFLTGKSISATARGLPREFIGSRASIPTDRAAATFTFSGMSAKPVPAEQWLTI